MRSQKNLFVCHYIVKLHIERFFLYSIFEDMSDCYIQQHSTLEIFPDELFFELFEYIPINDLYRTFFGLNKRIDIILRSLSNLFAEWTTNTDDQIIDIFSSSISRLVVWRGGHLNLNRFNKLHSLKLALPSIEQCNEIRPSVTLKHLHIDSSINSNTMTDQLATLFLTNSFPRLRTCRIDEITFEKENFQQILSLHSLVTRTQNPAKLLSLCPMLVHLRLNLTNNISESFLSDPHLYLRHLELGIYSTEINLSTIKLILSLTPNLTRFTLDGPCNPPSQNKIDINSLVLILTRHLLKLRSIRISLPLNDSNLDSKEFENEKEFLQKLHPLFNRIIFRPRSYYAPGRLLISSMVYN
jgi:hypothetical protein